MKALYIGLLSLLASVSCTTRQYTVVGSASDRSFDGKMLYLRVLRDSTMEILDSCEIIHGQFCFTGDFQGVELASLLVDEEQLMPLVLEDGDLRVDLDVTGSFVSGTPLNDSLYHFLRRKKSIDNQLHDLPKRESRMIMDGMEHDEIIQILNKEYDRLVHEGDQLVTRFIVENMNNVLGPGGFMVLTSDLPYPLLTPQIEFILTKASAQFKEHPYVKEYMEVARENMEKIRQNEMPDYRE